MHKTFLKTCINIKVFSRNKTLGFSNPHYFYHTDLVINYKTHFFSLNYFLKKRESKDSVSYS